MPLLGKAVTRGHLVGVALGLAGAFLALMEVGDGGAASLHGDAFAFIGAVTVVGYLLAGRYLRSEKGMPIFIYAFPVTMMAGVWLTIYSMAAEGTSLSGLSPESSILGWVDWAWLPWVAFLSLGHGLCGHTGINTVLRWVSPIVVSITMLMEPVLGTLIGLAWTGRQIWDPHHTWWLPDDLWCCGGHCPRGREDRRGIAFLNQSPVQGPWSQYLFS